MNNRKMHIVMIGDGMVGKTSILKTYQGKMFNAQHIKTIGIDYINAKYQGPNEKEYEVKMWDTAGQERFRTITYQFYKQAHGIVIVFDITNQETFLAVRAWLASIYKYSDQQVAKVLVGNKTDLNDIRVVEESKAR